MIQFFGAPRDPFGIGSDAKLLGCAGEKDIQPLDPIQNCV
jgi:hypothetical protein